MLWVCFIFAFFAHAQGEIQTLKQLWILLEMFSLLEDEILDVLELLARDSHLHAEILIKEQARAYAGQLIDLSSDFIAVIKSFLNKQHDMSPEIHDLL